MSTNLFYRINFHLEMNNPEEVTAMENQFAEEVRKRGEDFKYYKSQVVLNILFYKHHHYIYQNKRSYFACPQLFSLKYYSFTRHPGR